MMGGFGRPDLHWLPRAPSRIPEVFAANTSLSLQNGQTPFYFEPLGSKLLFNFAIFQWS